MITPLRRAHRGIFVGLSLLLPAIFLSSLLNRPDQGINASLPSSLQSEFADREGAWADADPLVYRSATAPELGAELPPGAQLVGSLKSTSPEQRVTKAGAQSYFVYSLAKQEVLAVFDAQGEIQ